MHYIQTELLTYLLEHILLEAFPVQVDGCSVSQLLRLHILASFWFLSLSHTTSNPSGNYNSSTLKTHPESNYFYQYLIQVSCLYYYNSLLLFFSPSQAILNSLRIFQWIPYFIQSKSHLQWLKVLLLKVPEAIRNLLEMQNLRPSPIPSGGDSSFSQDPR